MDCGDLAPLFGTLRDAIQPGSADSKTCTSWLSNLMTDLLVVRGKKTLVMGETDPLIMPRPDGLREDLPHHAAALGAGEAMLAPLVVESELVVLQS